MINLFNTHYVSTVKAQQSSLFIIVLYRKPALFPLFFYGLWGPAPVSSDSGVRYFLGFIDDHARIRRLYMMKCKSEVSAMFQAFYRMVLTPFDSSFSDRERYENSPPVK